ncbi:uncharacterized protein fam83ha isoform X2 [Brachyhypopomus gauderio]|uniref:uncharacterized protein fam83ha isoform X2 n=1 Tax=Brachyhypopomus gauderio TaxID=698409 RepID=UPI004041AFB4
MARRSQCSSAGDNPLDPNYLPPHYREEYRLAVDALIEADLEGYYKFLHKANIVDFLSQPEIEYIKCTVQEPRTTTQPDRSYMVGDADGSSDTYWPVHTDLDAPALDLGWPQQYRVVGPTEIMTLVSPADPEMPSIKEQARRMIKNAQQVIAVAMDMFTDVDIFADILNAALRNVAVYVLLDELNAHHFVAMVNNFKVNLDEFKFMRVRTVSGNTYYCHTGKFFKGQMMNCFMLVDCRVVLSGNYSFMWSFEKIHRCIAHVFLGQFVTTFDKEFRILYAQSEPLVAEIPMPYVEDYGNFPERHYNIENMHMFKREYPPIHAELPRHSFEDHMSVNAKILPFRRGEIISGSIENLPFQMHVTQQFRGEHTRLLKGFKETGEIQRLGYAGQPSYAHVCPQKNAMNSGRQQIEGTEIQSTHFPREQYYNQRTGPEPTYEKYSKSRDYSSQQFTGPDCPDEIDGRDPSGDYDHVNRYLQSYPAVEAETTGNLAVPVQSVPRRYSMGQSYTCQTPPTQPDPPEQKCFFNVHHNQQEQKDGLRDWRVSSYLTGLQYGGQDNITDLQRTDPFVNVPYITQERSNKPEISEIKQDNSEPAKVSTSRFNPLPVLPMNSQTPPENSADLLENFRPLVTNTRITQTTTSESSYPTESDKMEEILNREPKETNLIREEFFRRRPNLPMQRSSRLRHSLIFNSNLEQDTSEEINSESQKDAEKTLKHSQFVSNILEKKIPVTREPFQWSTLAKSFCEPSSVSTISENISSKTEQTSVGDENTQPLVKDAKQEITLDPQGIQLQYHLAENSQISQLSSTALQRSVSLTDLNDHQKRLRFFKELVKHKENVLMELPKATKVKDPKKCDKETSLSFNLVQQNESSLKNPQTSPASKETLLTTPQILLVDNSQDTVPKQPGLQTFPDKHLKHKFTPDPNISREITNAPKCDSSSKVIADTATDAEKIQHMKKLTGGCDSSLNKMQKTKAENLVGELGAKPKHTSLLTPISSPEFMTGQNKLPKITESVGSVTSPNSSKLTLTDSISSQVLTGADGLLKLNIMQMDLSLTDHSKDLATVNATRANTSLSKHPAAKETICFLHNTAKEAGSSKHNIPLRPGFSHFPPAECHCEHPIATPANTETSHPSVTETGPFSNSTVENTVSLEHGTVPETDSSKHPTSQYSAPALHHATSHTGPSQHSVLTEIGHAGHPAEIEKTSSVHSTMVVTGQRLVPTSEGKSTPWHPTVIDVVSIDIGQQPTPIPPTTDISETEMVSSASSIVTDTELHSTHTSSEKDDHQNPTFIETAFSAHAIVTVTVQPPTPSPPDIDTLQQLNATDPSVQNTVADTGHHPTPATETVCSLNAVKDKNLHHTPPETDTSQHLTATDSSLCTVVTTTEQPPTPTPPETDTSQHLTSAVMASSLCSSVMDTDPQLSLSDTLIPQHATVTEISSANAAITVIDQHPAPAQTDSTQYCTATEMDSSQDTTVNIAAQHHTPTSADTDTLSPLTAMVTVSSAQTTSKVTYQQSSLALLETDPPQNSPATQLDSSVYTTATDTDQHPTLIQAKTDTPQPQTATMTVFSLCTAVKGQHPTPSPPETDTSQHLTSAVMASSLCSSVMDTDPQLSPSDTLIPQHATVTEISSANAAITVIDQHPAPAQTDSTQYCTATEMDSSQDTTVHVAAQHLTPPPPDTDTMPPLTATVTVSSALSTLTVTDPHPSPTLPETDAPQDVPAAQTDSSLQTVVNVTDQHLTTIPPETDTFSPTIATAMISVIEQCPYPTLPETDTHHLPTTETDSSLQTTVTVTDQYPTFTPVKTDTPQTPTATETESLHTTVADQRARNPTPAETGLLKYSTSQIDLAENVAATGTVSSTISAGTDSGLSIHSSPAETGLFTHLTSTEVGHAEHPDAKDTVSSLHTTEAEIGHCQHPIPPETGPSQHATPIVSGHSQNPTQTDTIHSQSSAPVETFNTEHPAATEKNCSVQNTVTVTNQSLTPAPVVTNISKHSSAIDTVSFVYTTEKVIEKHFTPKQPFTDTQYPTATEPALSKHSSPVEKETAQNLTAAPTQSFQHSFSANTCPSQHPSPTISITSTSERVQGLCGVQSPSFSSDIVSINLCQMESVSSPNVPEACLITNPTATDRLQNVSLIGTTSSTEHSKSNPSFSNCAHQECTSTPFSRQKEFTSESNGQTKQSPFLNNMESPNHSTLCPLDPNPRPLTTLSSVMDGLNHNLAAVCKPVNLVRDTQGDHEIDQSGSHILSKPGKELHCSHDLKTEENLEKNLGRHGIAKVNMDMGNSKVNKVKEFTSQGVSFGFSNIDQSQEPHCGLTPSTDFVVQQQPPAAKKSILSSCQSSTANVLSYSNLRDDTKVLLEQISARNQCRASNLTCEEGEANGKRTKQTSGHHAQTWSSKASPEEREKLIKRIDSLRKERRVYSRFEA